MTQLASIRCSQIEAIHLPRHDNGKLLGHTVVENRDGIYLTDGKVVQLKNLVLSTSRHNKDGVKGIELWYKRFGDVRKDVITKMSKGHTKGTNVNVQADLISSDACMDDKQTKFACNGLLTVGTDEPIV